MKNKLIALTVASIFALTACGGGSDDGGTKQPVNDTTAEDAQKAEEAKKAESEQALVNG